MKGRLHPPQSPSSLWHPRPHFTSYWISDLLGVFHPDLLAVFLNKMSKVTSTKPKIPSDFSKPLTLQQALSRRTFQQKPRVSHLWPNYLCEMLIWQREKERHRLFIKPQPVDSQNPLRCCDRRRQLHPCPYLQQRWRSSSKTVPHSCSLSFLVWCWP